jgi:hypothetical protein
MTLAAAVIGLLGSVHLIYTFHGPKLLPRNPDLVRRMRDSALVLTRETSVWRAWIGFNASHSLAAILFGLLYGYLALLQPQLLFGSWFLQGVALAMLGTLLWLAWRYWFRIPFFGIAVALGCAIAASIAARVGL